VTESATRIVSGRRATEATGSLARVGLVARGATYLMVGWLALLTAVGVGSAGIADKQQALQAVSTHPLGMFLLILISAGLLAYALWSLIRAVFDPERRGDEVGAYVARVGNAAAAVSYAGLGAGAVRFALGLGEMSKGSDASTQDWTARLLEAPFGPPLVAGLGAVALGTAAVEFGRAYKATFLKDLRGVTGTERVWLSRFGRAGMAARGVVFALVGVFLIQAARHDDPSRAVGLGGALQALADQPEGPWLLGLVAVGLCMYGLFSFAEARYRKLGAA
jgi:hypothetical protein